MTFAFWPTLALGTNTMTGASFTRTDVVPVADPSTSIPAFGGVTVLPTPSVGTIYEPGRITKTVPIGLGVEIDVQVSPMKIIMAEYDLDGIQIPSGDEGALVEVY